jgi:hypothetical protein
MEGVDDIGWSGDVFVCDLTIGFRGEHAHGGVWNGKYDVE